MEPPGWDWPAVAALATLAIAVITAGVGIATCYFIREGIRAMNNSSDERARDRKQAQEAQEADRKQAHATLEEERRRAREELAEWRRTQEAWREADERRHEEAMEDSRHRHEESMAALAALIERTGGPRPAPAE